MSEDDLNKILARPGYKLESTLKSQIGTRTVESEIKRTRQEHDLESASGDESLHSEKLQINYSGKPEIRITFYRHRLADHSRAISEKALVDSLQYAGLIGGDSENEIRLTDVIQKKIGKDEEERTEITIDYPEVDLDNLWVKAKENKAR